MRILIIGANGQLGVELMQRAADFHWEAYGADLPGCDITSTKSLRQAFKQDAPLDAVINAAAYTAVDQAEEDVDLAYAVNRDGPANLAKACNEINIPLIHISTDYVFDGLQTRPYRPTDAAGPIGVYGKSKFAGEAAIRENCARHIIVRTSWLFGAHGPNFVKTMLRLGDEREVLQVVDDQIGSPTYAGDLADALLTMATHVTNKNSGWGTHHYCNVGALTWYAFARKIFTFARPYTNHIVREVIPILTHSYPTPAPRPQYSVLDCTSLENTFSITRRPWQAALKEMLGAIYIFKE